MQLGIYWKLSRTGGGIVVVYIFKRRVAGFWFRQPITDQFTLLSLESQPAIQQEAFPCSFWLAFQKSFIFSFIFCGKHNICTQTAQLDVHTFIYSFLKTIIHLSEWQPASICPFNCYSPFQIIFFLGQRPIFVLIRKFH